MKRGKHGCYVHTERSSSDMRNWRLVKCSRHHAPMGAPTPESPTGVLGTVCSGCGATAVITPVLNAKGQRVGVHYDWILTGDGAAVRHGA